MYTHSFHVYCKEGVYPDIIARREENIQKMALTDPKLPPRFAVSDWHTSNTVIRTNAERQRDASHRVRQESRFLRNETDNHTRWTQHDSNTKLEKRIHDINNWKKSLERCLAETDAEIALLQQEKERTERALEAKKVPLDITLECLMLRENRQNIDLVRDEVEAQLHKVRMTGKSFFVCLKSLVSRYVQCYESRCLLIFCVNVNISRTKTFLIFCFTGR